MKDKKLIKEAVLYSSVEPDIARQKRFRDFIAAKYGPDIQLIWK